MPYHPLQACLRGQTTGHSLYVWQSAINNRLAQSGPSNLATANSNLLQLPCTTAHHKQLPDTTYGCVINESHTILQQVKILPRIPRLFCLFCATCRDHTHSHLVIAATSICPPPQNQGAIAPIRHCPTQRTSHGTTLGIPWHYLGHPMALPWASHGTTLGICTCISHTLSTQLTPQPLAIHLSTPQSQPEVPPAPGSLPGQPCPIPSHPIPQLMRSPGQPPAQLSSS